MIVQLKLSVPSDCLNDVQYHIDQLFKMSERKSFGYVYYGFDRENEGLGRRKKRVYAVNRDFGRSSGKLFD